jgi:hypothetical protein
MTGPVFGMSNLVRGVRHTVCGLDVVQRPSSPPFRYEFPAQNLESL